MDVRILRCYFMHTGTQRKYVSKVMFFDSICYIMEIKRNTRMSWQMRWGILATGNTAGKFASTILAMENERETLAAAGHHSDNASSANIAVPPFGKGSRISNRNKRPNNCQQFPVFNAGDMEKQCRKQHNPGVPPNSKYTVYCFIDKSDGNKVNQ